MCPKFGQAGFLAIQPDMPKSLIVQSWGAAKELRFI